MPNLQLPPSEVDRPEAAPVTARRRPESTRQTAAGLTRQVASADLFSGAKKVLIEHSGEQYRLIVTKNNKLLLQK